MRQLVGVCRVPACNCKNLKCDGSKGRAVSKPKIYIRDRIYVPSRSFPDLQEAKDAYLGSATALPLVVLHGVIAAIKSLNLSSYQFFGSLIGSSKSVMTNILNL